jgi:hypothetical protein
VAQEAKMLACDDYQAVSLSNTLGVKVSATPRCPFDRYASRPRFHTNKK